MNGFFTLIPFPLFFNNSYTEVVLSLHFLSEVYLYPFFSLFSYTAVLRTCWRSLSFVVLHGCGAYTPIWLFCIVNKEIHQFDGSEYEIF
jgi:hypothetical protein